MYEKEIMPNGVRIVYERVPHVRSAAVGIWVGVGSRHEKKGEGGAAHFIEHMLFKGTSNRTASELAGEMDAIGGQINAFTTRDSTCFYARVLDSHLTDAIDLLSDMFFESRFDEEDARSERGVIMEEIDMYNDTPDDLAVERLMSGCFKGALGRPVLGRASTLTGMTGESLRGFKQALYLAPRVVISLSGSFGEAELGMIREKFSRLDKASAPEPRKCDYTPSLTVKKKATEQNYLCLAFPGLPTGSGDRFALQLFSNILGGGMSSRLFQTVREKHGLCYSIYTFNASYAGTGLFGVETALGRETEERAIGLIMDELRRISGEGVTEPELSRAREQVKSGLVLSMESTSSRMSKLGAGELTMGRSLSVDELIGIYDSVSLEDIADISQRILCFDRMSFSAVGRVEKPDVYWEIIGKVS